MQNMAELTKCSGRECIKYTAVDRQRITKPEQANSHHSSNYKDSFPSACECWQMAGQKTKAALRKSG